MRKIILISAAVVSLILSGCVSMAPVSNMFENARTLDKGQVELMGGYSMSFLNADDENGARQTDQTNNNIGLRLGYGIANRFDIKLRYERLMPVTSEDKQGINGANYYGLSSRYAIIKGKLSGGLELGLYGYTIKETTDIEAYKDSNFAISPKLALTFPSDKNFDLTLSTKFDFFTSDGINLWHLNLGTGISSNASQWSVRPEIGIIKDLDNFSNYTWVTGGVGFISNINPPKKQ